MSLPVYANLDALQRPSNGNGILAAWGDQVNDDVAFLFGEAAWTSPAWQNSWIQYAGTEAVGYKRIGNEVRLRGSMTGGAVNTVAFNLPAGYRPTGTKYFLCTGSGYTAAGVNINAAGDVTVGNIGGGLVSLDQVSFFVT